MNLRFRKDLMKNVKQLKEELIKENLMEDVLYEYRSDCSPKGTFIRH